MLLLCNATLDPWIVPPSAQDQLSCGCISLDAVPTVDHNLAAEETLSAINVGYEFDPHHFQQRDTIQPMACHLPKTGVYQQQLFQLFHTMIGMEYLCSLITSGSC